MDDGELNFESCDEIFDSSRGQSTYNFDGEGTNCQLMEKNASVTESNGHVESAIEVSFRSIYLIVCLSNSIFCCSNICAKQFSLCTQDTK